MIFPPKEPTAAAPPLPTATPPAETATPGHHPRKTQPEEGRPPTGREKMPTGASGQKWQGRLEFNLTFVKVMCQVQMFRFKTRLSERWNSLLHHTEQWSRRLDEMLPVSEKKESMSRGLTKKERIEEAKPFIFSVHIPFPDSNFAQSFFCSKKGERGREKLLFPCSLLRESRKVDLRNFPSSSSCSISKEDDEQRLSSLLHDTTIDQGGRIPRQRQRKRNTNNPSPPKQLKRKAQSQPLLRNSKSGGRISFSMWELGMG